MARISDTELGIALKLAAEKCMAEDEALFMGLDVSESEVDPHVKKRVMCAAHFDEWKSVCRTAVKIVRNAILIFMSASVLCFAAAMCIQPIRAASLEAVRNWYENYIRIEYEEKKFTGEFQPMLPSFIPDGWEVVKMQIEQRYVSFVMKNEEGGVFRYTQNQITADPEFYTDDADSAEKSVSLKNSAEVYPYKHDENCYHVIWFDNYKFYVYSDGMILQQLIRVLNSIKPAE